MVTGSKTAKKSNFARWSLFSYPTTYPSSAHIQYPYMVYKAAYNIVIWSVWDSLCESTMKFAILGGHCKSWICPAEDAATWVEDYRWNLWSHRCKENSLHGEIEMQLFCPTVRILMQTFEMLHEIMQLVSFPGHMHERNTPHGLGARLCAFLLIWNHGN